MATYIALNRGKNHNITINSMKKLHMLYFFVYKEKPISPESTNAFT